MVLGWDWVVWEEGYCLVTGRGRQFGMRKVIKECEVGLGTKGGGLDRGYSEKVRNE